jgi:glutamyl-tRNA synthetase
MGDRFAANLQLDALALERIPEFDWLPPALEGALRTVAEVNGLKLGDVMQPVRVALTGGTVSEPVHELLAVVGRDESLRRIRAAAS